MSKTSQNKKEKPKNRMTLFQNDDAKKADFSPLMKSERLYLREVRVSDVNEKYYCWMNDPEINHYLETRFATQSLESIAEFVKKTDADPDVHFMAICDLAGGEHIGNIKLGPINWHHRRADVGLLIGEKNYWGKGLATEAIAMVTAYAFKNLGLNKLKAGCYTANEASTRAFEKCGWTREGLLKGEVMLDGKPHDCILLGITADDYKGLKDK